MDELLLDFLTETGESLDRVDAELVRFEQEPNNGQILGNIFRLVHTIKGTCGFLALSRLERLTHAAETLMGKFRDGMPVTTDAVTLILATLDRIKTVLNGIETLEREPDGDDADLIERLGRMARGEQAPSPPAPPEEPPQQAPAPVESKRSEDLPAEAAEKRAEGLEKPAAESADKLANHSIRVAHEAENGEPVLAGGIYVAPGGRHMRVTRNTDGISIAIGDDEPINFCKPAVDALFSSAAAVWGPASLALVLTGMGADGSRGATDIVAAGGSVIAQDEATSVVWGMPRCVAQAGLCSAVLPLDQIAPKIIRLFSGDRS